MRRTPRAVALSLCLLAAVSCEGAQADVGDVVHSSVALARVQRLAQRRADSATTTDHSAPLAQWLLPHALQEISGLALTSDGRLLTHDDEVGQVWEIDYRSGAVVKRFGLGAGDIHGDFEGMAVANDAIYMLTSRGKLYEFAEAANGARADYDVYDTGLARACEFEGVAFDRAANSLLFACKLVLNAASRDSLVIYRWRLDSDSATRISRLAIGVAGVLAANGWKALHPSDITVDPLTGNYVLLASAESAIMSVTPAGEVVFARALPARHHQPEGIAITKDSILIISDEAGKRPAIITLYRWP
ncbi:MAG TPA: SdiA-regulated domain-containing protein [Gemmatimonadaceae bacterium]|nr:SdiA-regulated domain-containing protein [Gemmatimonadaceae bacterium]